jgi:amidase
VAPTAAVPHDHGGMERTIEVDGARVPYGAQGSWNTIASLLGFPVTVVPIGRSPSSGLPIGAQIVGPYLEDQTPLTFAALLEQERGGLFHPPGPPPWLAPARHLRDGERGVPDVDPAD